MQPNNGKHTAEEPRKSTDAQVLWFVTLALVLIVIATALSLDAWQKQHRRTKSGPDGWNYLFDRRVVALVDVSSAFKFTTCPAKDSFAKRTCSSRAALSSGMIRSTSASVFAASASVQSWWMRDSVRGGISPACAIEQKTIKSIQENPYEISFSVTLFVGTALLQT